MPEPAGDRGEARRSPRITLPAMYTMIRVREGEDDTFGEIGHIYDISESGMRFELDHEISAGTEVEIRALLPGKCHTTICAFGRIVRRHDDVDEFGPIRMGMVFERFVPAEGYDQLTSYLNQYQGRRAA